MRILIAGGQGYLGSVLCNLLAGRGHNVVAMDLGWFPTTLDSAVAVQTKNIFLATRQDLDGIEAVVFLAGLSNDPMADFSPAMNFAQNVGAPFHLARLARECGVKRFLYASSASVYGWQDREVSEQDQPLSISNYGVSKLLGERAVLGLLAKDFYVAAFRMGTLSGPSPRMRFDLLLNTMVHSAKTTGAIRVNAPKIWRPILDVRDAADLYCFALERPVALVGVYNAGNGNYRIAEFACMVQGQVPHCSLTISHDGREVRNYRMDTRKLGQLWEPARHVTATIEDVLHGWKEEYGHGDDHYWNIRTYRRMLDAVQHDQHSRLLGL